MLPRNRVAWTPAVVVYAVEDVTLRVLELHTHLKPALQMAPSLASSCQNGYGCQLFPRLHGATTCCPERSSERIMGLLCAR
eukprot:6329588-Amphidinium_carterae.1